MPPTCFVTAYFIAITVVQISGASKDADCDFTAAVEECHAHILDSDRCEYHKCLASRCPTLNSNIVSMSRSSCGTYLNVSDPLHVMPKKITQRKLSNHDAFDLTLPEPALQCPDLDVGNWSTARAQYLLHHVAWIGYEDRGNEHYSEDKNLRWYGIDHHICPLPGHVAPKYSDCSSFVTWIYWTIFGKGPDFLNGEHWKSGYTGTLKSHGANVSVDALQVGDLCFYYHPMHHVAIYVGGGRVISHGADPVGHYSLHYAPLDYCRRYIG